MFHTGAPNHFKFLLSSFFRLLLIKGVFPVLLSIAVSQPTYANKIDSLKTKEDVQKFLTDSLGKTGICYLKQCADVSRAERNRMYFNQPDTIMVEDPLTGEFIMRIVSRERQFRPYDFCFTDTPYPLNDSLAWAIPAIDKYSWRYYKADINQDGRTDLIIAPGIVVMDNGNRVQAHKFMWDIDSTIFRLEDVIHLADGSAAILFRNKFGKTDSSGNGIYKTDTIVYKYRGFAKYNARFKPAGISKIYYQYTHYECYGCPLDCDGIDCIEINKDGRCFLRHSEFDSVFSANLNSIRLTDLWNLTSYVDVKAKKNCYAYAGAGVDGGSTNGTLIVYFDDGTVKKITISECIPPMGLNYITRNISDISRELHWQPAVKPDFACQPAFPILNIQSNGVWTAEGCECEW